MKIIFFIVILVFTITGCAPNRYGTIGDNENSVSVNVNIFDKAKGPNNPKTIKVANDYCAKFNKTAKFLKEDFYGYVYTCN